MFCFLFSFSKFLSYNRKNLFYVSANWLAAIRSHCLPTPHRSPALLLTHYFMIHVKRCTHYCLSVCFFSVFGFFQTTFIGIERYEAHSVTIGTISGSPPQFIIIEVTLNRDTSGKTTHL